MTEGERVTQEGGKEELGVAMVEGCYGGWGKEAVVGRERRRIIGMQVRAAAAGGEGGREGGREGDRQYMWVGASGVGRGDMDPVPAPPC